LEDLKTAAPPERHPPLDRQLDLLTAAVARTFRDADRRAALVPDQQGIGSGPAVDDGRTPSSSGALEPAAPGRHD
jgi:hypothetical protein